jgi:hypothetical protein
MAKLLEHEFETWLLDHQNYYSFEQLYIESLYYSAQTILTVGYGDHSPKNLKEVTFLYQFFYSVNRFHHFHDYRMCSLFYHDQLYYFQLHF